MYERISKQDGVKFFPSIGTVFVSNDRKLWANPFENEEQRARCFFKITDPETMEIMFHLTKKESVDLMSRTFPCKTYFFGAYNQINVCQMRAFGELSLLKKASDIRKFKKQLKVDLDARTNDTNVSSMDQVTTAEKLKALKKISYGFFFKFIPTSYAYHTYERG